MSSIFTDARNAHNSSTKNAHNTECKNPVLCHNVVKKNVKVTPTQVQRSLIIQAELVPPLSGLLSPHPSPQCLSQGTQRSLTTHRVASASTWHGHPGRGSGCPRDSRINTPGTVLWKRVAHFTGNVHFAYDVDDRTFSSLYLTYDFFF